MHDATAARRAQALEEAATWLIRLGEHDLSDADVDAWNAWMEASPLHAQAFADIDLLWEAAADVDPDRVQAAREAQAPRVAPVAGDDAARAAITPAVTEATFRPRSSVRTARAGHRGRRAGAWAALAASVAAVAVTVGLWRADAPQAGSEMHLVAAVGTPRQTTLADGSRIDLDAGSEIVVQYSSQRRQVELVRGQAYFSVAKDPARPFEVRAGGAMAQALGTRFVVARRAEGERVSVTEGRVQVTDLRVDGGAAHQVVQLAANQSTTLVENGPLLAPVAHEPASTLSWLDGNVTYRRESLRNVVADLNRYSSRPIVLQDEAMARMQVTGRWQTNDLDAWLDSVARALSLRVVRDGERIVLTRSGPAPRASDQSGADALTARGLQ
ncbi:FecR domain-containing protein [Luteimonas sp. RC10]|uniref:FecR family protein n=1 Tax=Luteimonas sp. RC10 TaxID=2587035 RepID=UPI0016201556|nr:FecR domain-containing protein [Luteimonas sp. RC10]MBB3343204.1 transmembrane sensor [Luteimonas sp. RC10]